MKTQKLTQIELRDIIQNEIEKGTQLFCYDKKSIFLPTPQKSGTLTQGKTYAKLAANEIVKKHFDYLLPLVSIFR